MSANILKVSLGVSLVALVSGFCYAYGEDVRQSYEAVDNGVRKAAEQGDAEAQCQLGDCYLYGKGVSKSAEEALKWYQKAAEQGYADAQYRLGVLYYLGQFFEEAVKWFRMAAEQGHAKAQCSLGTCYYSGQGVSQSFEEAAKWFRKAAEQGNEAARMWCPCKNAVLLNVAYETSYTEFAESQQKKEKYLYRLGKVNTVLQAWANLSEHIMNCPSCGSEFKSAIVRPLYQTKSQLDAMRTYLENAVSRGLKGDNELEDNLIELFELLDKVSKPLRDLISIDIGVG